MFPNSTAKGSENCWTSLNRRTRRAMMNLTKRCACSPVCCTRLCAPHCCVLRMVCRAHHVNRWPELPNNFQWATAPRLKDQHSKSKKLNTSWWNCHLLNMYCDENLLYRWIACRCGCKAISSTNFMTRGATGGAWRMAWHQSLHHFSAIEQFVTIQILELF